MKECENTDASMSGGTDDPADGANKGERSDRRCSNSCNNRSNSSFIARLRNNDES